MLPYIVKFLKTWLIQGYWDKEIILNYLFRIWIPQVSIRERKKEVRPHIEGKVETGILRPQAKDCQEPYWPFPGRGKEKILS